MGNRPDPQRDAELLTQLDEKTARLLFPERFSDPLQVTLVFPTLEGEAAAAAADALEAAAANDQDPDGRTRASFDLEHIEALHTLYGIVDAHAAAADVEILLDGKQLPLTRELWLPLLWNLRA